MDECRLEIVKRATVRIDTKTGQGVLIPGGYILTAAHCIAWDHTGGMVLGDYYVEPITATNGKQYSVSPCAVEPCRDIALLANVDGGQSEEMYAAWEAFDEFCEATPLVEIIFEPVPYEEPLEVFILSHHGKWITGKATRHATEDVGGIGLKPDSEIECGTSGGPVITKDGRLLGVVSKDQSLPVITALPYWAVELIRKSQLESAGYGE